MFGSTRIFHFLLVALSIVVVAQATLPGENLGVHRREVVVKRQKNSGTDVSAGADETSTPSSTPKTTSTKKPDPTPTPDETTTKEPDSTPPKTSDPAPETTEAPKTTDNADTTSDKNTEPIVETTVVVVTGTNENGQVTEITSAMTTTRTPGLSDSSSNGSSSGMSAHTRNIVIGVVVGVGGAVVLGALGFVAWRIWGKKRHHEDDTNLMNYNAGYAGVEKSEGGSSQGGAPAGRNPFQSTLETYHAPVNASSNF